MPRLWQRVLITLLLIGLLAVAAALRLTNINWDQFQHVHPDERFIVWVADSVTRPADLATALDPLRSTINPFRWPPDHGDEAGKPRSYAYGHVPLYLLVVVAHAAQAAGQWLGETTLALPAILQPLHTVGRHLAEYNYLALVGRAISTLCDLGTLLLIYSLGRRAYGQIAGLLAAGAYAFAVLPIQLSHFYAVDVVLTFCVVATVALAARRAEGGGWPAWIGAGIFAGLAVGSKFSAILIAAPLVAATWYRAADGAARRRIASVTGQLAVVGAAAALTFVVTNPFAVIELRAYASNVLAQNAMVSGLMDAPYTRQYIGTLPYWYFVQQLSQWGLGWPLGLVAWGGFVWALIRFGMGRAGRVEVVMLAWALTYFALTGAFHAKFLRYMAPLLPFLLIFGAGAALAAYRWLVNRWGQRGRIAWGVVALFIAAITVGWSSAFVGVYRQEHPWLQASRWIYSNIPEGSKLLTEHWDDALPLRMDEIAGRPPLREYRRVELPLYDPDTSTKLDTLVDELGSADYLILASNRLSAPISRLRERYPMTSSYYRLLESGELGYTPAAEFVAYPQLLGLTIPDDHADESFTVYDHPRVIIYRNTERLSSALLRARLERYLPRATGEGTRLKVEGSASDSQLSTFDLQPSTSGRPPGHARYLPQSTREGSRSQVEGESPQSQLSTFNLQPPTSNRPPTAPLTLDRPVDTLPVVADFRWNRIASENPIVATLLWWLALSVIGWTAWPLLFPLLGGLQDRGFGLTRTAGWLLIGWVHWMAVSLGLFQNRLAPLALICAGLVLAGAAAWWIQRRRIGAFLANRRRLLLGEEGLFALAFVAFVGIRILNPDLWQPWNGGEKFMESAFLNAILRSPHFPPYDPYFAGGSLNYYYFGLYLVSIPIKLTGIASEVAYNLAVPSLFALTAVGIFSVGHALADCGRQTEEREQERGGLGARPVIAGLSSVVLALLMGNLDALSQFVEQLKARLAGLPVPGFDYWASSRVIPETINEFPFWTFLFADLHPHLIAMPFGVLVAGLAINWVFEADGWRLEAGSGRGRLLLRVPLSTCLLALALGAMGAINTWDLPTYFLLVAGALLIAAWRSRRVRFMMGSLALIAGISAAAVVAYLPFYAHYQSQFGDQTGPLLDRYLGWVRAASPLIPWLTVWGIPFFFSLSALAGLWLARHRREAHASRAQDAALPASLDAVVLEAGGPPGLIEQEAPELTRAEIDESRGDIRIDDAGDIASDGTSEDEMAFSTREIADDGALAADVDGVPESSAQGVAESPSRVRPRLRLLVVLAWIGLVLLLVALDRTAAALMILLLGMTLPLVFVRSVPPEDNLLALLLALGAGVVAGTELVFLHDFLAGGDWYRMNTLFKFSVPAWLLLGIACGVMLPRLWYELSRLPGWVAVLWRLALVLAVLAGLLFLPLGIPARVKDRFPGARPPIGTLNGMDYMTVGKLAWPDAQHEIDLATDYLAIRWLLDHVTGTPVIAEAPAGGYMVDGQAVTADYYRAGGLRAASFTGLPTFVGQHQNEQRPGDQVGQRTQLGQEFFATTDLTRARELMRQLRVGYVYVGPLERILFQPESLRKFDTLVEQGELETVYRNQQVTIYRVVASQ